MPATSPAYRQAQLAAATAHVLYWYLMLLLQRSFNMHDLHVLYRWCRHWLREGAKEAGG